MEKKRYAANAGKGERPDGMERKRRLPAGAGFWMVSGLEYIGIVLGGALGMAVLAGFQGGHGPGNSGSVISYFVSLLPWYILLMCGLALFMWMMSCFQAFLPLTVALNGTRKNAFLGMNAVALVLIGCSVGGCSIIWNVLRNDIAEAARGLLIPACGVLFAVEGIALFMGATILRWGRIGIGIAVGACIGGCCGLGFAMGISGNLQRRMTDLARWIEEGPVLLVNGAALGAGLLVLLLAEVFAAGCIRKMEAHA